MILTRHFFNFRLVAENEKVRARNLYLESKRLDRSSKETVIFSGKGKSNITVIPKNVEISKLSVDDGVADMHTSVSTDSLDKMIEKGEAKDEENEVETSKVVDKANKNLPEDVEVGNEVEVEVDLNILEGGRSARLCAKLKKVAQEKEKLRQVRRYIYTQAYKYTNMLAHSQPSR